MPPLLHGVGIGWRPELAWPIARRPRLGFIEIVAEDFDPAHLPVEIDQLRSRGVPVVPHGVSLSLGSAAPPDRDRIERLARLAQRVDAPLVSEHVAFVRADGLETGHLIPVPYSRDMLEILVENVAQTMARLPVPLALENIATLMEWPDAEIEPGEFLRELLDRTGALLLLDVENVYANARNHHHDPRHLLRSMPLDRIAYVHVAGGIERDGVYHDTHQHPIPSAVLDLLSDLTSIAEVPAAMLERDGRFPPEAELFAELDAIEAALTMKEARHAG